MALHKVFIKSINEIRKFVPYDENYINQMSIIRNHEQYESIFLYEDKHIEYYNTHTNKKGNNTLAGIEDVYTDKVVFDFDSKHDKQKALDDARTLVSRLQAFIESKTAIRCYYSGDKGYHVEVQFNPEQYISQPEFEAIINFYAGDLDTFDSKIKDPQRVFRFPLSQNKTTRKYKIPIGIDDFMNAEITHDNISAVAELKTLEDKELVISTIASFGTVDVPTQFREAITKIKEKKTTTLKEVIVSQEKPDMTRYNRELTPAKYALSLGFFDEGERNEAGMILAATYKYKGYTKHQAYGLIKCAVAYRNERLGLGELDEEVKSKIWYENIEQVFSETWKGATYSDTTNELLQKTIQKYELENYYNPTTNVEVLEIAQVGDLFLRFADDIDNSLIKTGIQEIDDNLLLTSSMMVGILGAPSSGKTSFVLNMLEHQSVNGISSFIMSSDMAPQLLYASLLRRYCRKSFKETLDTIKKVKMVNWPKDMKDAWDKVQENFKNVGMCFKSGPTIEDCRQQVDAYEQKTGNAVRAFAMDYLEKMLSKYSDPTASTGYNAARLADFTRDKNMTTLLLLQTQKAAGDPSDELLSMRNIKGASVIEQDCRVVLTTWRAGFNPDVKGFNKDDKYASFAVVKNNMGSTGRYDLHVDPYSGLYRSLTDEELAEFENVKIRTAERKLNKIRTKNGMGAANSTGQPVRFVAKSTTEVKTAPTENNNVTLFTKKPESSPAKSVF